MSDKQPTVRGVPFDIGPEIAYHGDQFEYWCEEKKRLAISGNPYPVDTMQADLNERGKNGWELISVHAMVNAQMLTVQMIWKRKVQRVIQ